MYWNFSSEGGWILLDLYMWAAGLEKIQNLKRKNTLAFKSVWATSPWVFTTLYYHLSLQRLVNAPCKALSPPHFKCITQCIQLSEAPRNSSLSSYNYWNDAHWQQSYITHTHAHLHTQLPPTGSATTLLNLSTAAACMCFNACIQAEYTWVHVYVWASEFKHANILYL